MAPDTTRRRLLQTLGGGTAVGLTGCITAGSPPEETTYPQPPEDGDEPAGGQNGTESQPTDQTTARSKTYGFVVNNELTAENFEASDELSAVEPAVIHLRVNNLDPDDEKTYFEKTVELEIGESKSFPEAFTVRGARTMYAISAVLEPFVQGGLSRNSNRKAGYTFTAWTDTMPNQNPISVNLVSIDDDSDNVIGSGDQTTAALYPDINIDAREY